MSAWEPLLGEHMHTYRWRENAPLWRELVVKGNIELWFSHRIVCTCFTTSTQHTVTMAPPGFYCFHNVVSACPSPPRPSPSPPRPSLQECHVQHPDDRGPFSPPCWQGEQLGSTITPPHPTPPHPLFIPPPTTHPPPTPPPLRPSSWTGDRFAAMRLCTAPLLCSSLGLPGTGSWSGTRPPSSWSSTSATSSS